MKISEYFEIKSEMKIFIQLKFAANVSKKIIQINELNWKILCHAVIYLTLFECSSRTTKYLKILPKTVWEEKVENLGQVGFKIFE